MKKYKSKTKYNKNKRNQNRKKKKSYYAIVYNIIYIMCIIFII